MESAFGGYTSSYLILALHSQIFENLREFVCRRALSTCNRLVQKKKKQKSRFPTETPDHYWHVFATSDSPINRSSTKKKPMSSTSIVHGGQNDTK